MVNSNTFVYSYMFSNARLQSLSSDSKPSTERINLKPTPVTAAGLEVFEEVSTAYEYLVSEAPSQTNLKNKDSHISW